MSAYGVNGLRVWTLIDGGDAMHPVADAQGRPWKGVDTERGIQSIW
jgi:hypothetical protein